jgi:EAL domain-containing protein (putative c-di-GMP-specific phosphodiesterase class I)
LLRCSDLALIRAREAGGGRCCFYDAAMDVEINRQHALRQEFSSAVARGELELLYQPKIDLHSYRINGVEALVRWRKEGSLMSPGEFFPAIEHTDLMCELDWWVMEEALRHYSVWMAQGKLIPVSVNLSSATMRHDNFLARLQALIMRYPMPDGHLELEVLETISQKEAEEIVHKLERCREFGVSIALDDFGTGASSLVHLQQLPFDTIKIDQRFVRKLLMAPGNEAIIRSMISFAHYSGRKLVVEGVESKPIWNRLLEIGCSTGQGYAISPPISSSQLMIWIAEREPRISAV